MADLTEAQKNRLNAQAEELIKEFRDHVEEMRQGYGEGLDERLIFEAWAIQKIANAQVSLFDLVERIDKLNDSIRLLANVLRK